MTSSLTPPEIPQKPLTIAIVGAGNRGCTYASYAKSYPQWLKVVAVCDHHQNKCLAMAKEHSIISENIFVGDWTEMAKRPKLADAVAICTTDKIHGGPAVAFANLKYHILLEKPMSVTIDECALVYEAVKKNDIMLSVAHVLRYTEYTKSIKKVLDSNVLGDIVNIQHLEPVGFWHFAHSYVRGNWHNESESTFSLLAKCCHDIDFLTYLMNKKCTQVSSFGSLTHFKKENKPKEAGDAINCLNCAHESSCPYSAKRLYIDDFYKKYNSRHWPVNVVQPDGEIDIENLTDALQSGNYGRCVYEMDNDVCDHQVVNMEFENGSTASMTMVAFTEEISQRKTRIFGTKGQLEGDGNDNIRVYDFVTKEAKEIGPSKQPGLVLLPGSGHGGGDFELVKAFVYACISGDKRYIVSDAQETFESHVTVFAAEHARKNGTVVNIKNYRSMSFGNKRQDSLTQ